LMFGGIAIGVLCGVLLSYRIVSYTNVFTVEAMIHMVRGVFACKAMIAWFEVNQSGYSVELWGLMVGNVLKAVFIVAALAIGLAMPGLLFYRRRSVV